MQSKEILRIFNNSFNYLWGSLWWGREDFIMEHFKPWFYRGRKGHPLVSTKRKPIDEEYDSIPMLVGTTGVGRLTIYVTEGHPADFSRHVTSQAIHMEDFLEDNGRSDLPAYETRNLWPSSPKRHITPDEETALEKFLNRRRRTAYGKGWN